MKRIVICSDGTWNSPDEEEHGVLCPTNVVKIACRTGKSADAIPQIIYYHKGVGTGNLLDRLTGGAFGEGLDENIKEAYEFLVANYEPGDELFFFGFSRGAFTARSLAGMIRKCGILRRDAVMSFADAVALYRDAQDPDRAGPCDFREKHSIHGKAITPIRFIGVWDTVGALGIPWSDPHSRNRSKYEFHDIELSKAVQHAYQALAIDERRLPFVPSIWAYKSKPPQIVEQVWFCGVHSDIGGGYPEVALSDIALSWMLKKAQAAGLGIDETAVNALPLHQNPMGLKHDSMTVPYRLMGPVDRLIGLAIPVSGDHDAISGDPDPTQSVHETVLRRWDADSSYRPPQLLEYFRRTKDPRGTRP